MIFNKGFELVNVADEFIVVPVGDTSLSCPKIIVINEAAAYLLSQLQNVSRTKEELVQLLMDEYEVEKEKATADIETAIQDLIKNGVILE